MRFTSKYKSSEFRKKVRVAAGIVDLALALQGPEG